MVRLLLAAVTSQSLPMEDSEVQGVALSVLSLVLLQLVAGRASLQLAWSESAEPGLAESLMLVAAAEVLSSVALLAWDGSLSSAL